MADIENIVYEQARHGSKILKDTTNLTGVNFRAFYVLTDAIVSSYTVGNSAKDEGDLSGLTLAAGSYHPFDSRITQIQLTSGAIRLIK